MNQRRGLVPRLKPLEIHSNPGKVMYSVSYPHPKDNLRVLRATVCEQGRDHKSFNYTKLEDISIGAQEDTRKLAFATDYNNHFAFRYYKKNGIFYIEDSFFKNPSAVFPNRRPIDKSRFEELIREFSKEFFFVFQQDKSLNEYLDSWLRYFRDDFMKLDSEFDKKKLVVNSI